MQRNTIIDICNCILRTRTRAEQPAGHKWTPTVTAAFIPRWRDTPGCREASHTTVGAVQQNYLPSQCCVQYLEKFLPLAVINDNLDKEQVFHSGWGALRKGQISLRKLLKYWRIPVFNLPRFGKGSQLHWRMNLCVSYRISVLHLLLLRLSPMCHSWLGKIFECQAELQEWALQLNLLPWIKEHDMCRRLQG